MAKKGRKPHYRLKAQNRTTKYRCNDLGAGWKNKDGSITIILNPCTILQPDENISIHLFPIEDKRNDKK